MYLKNRKRYSLKKVYVAGAISAPTLEQGLKNLREGIFYGAMLLKMGYCPFVPHLDNQFSLVQNDLIPVEVFYQYDLEWLAVCDCMLVLPNYENSKGVAKEIKVAKKLGIPVFFDIRQLMEWHTPCLQEKEESVV